MSPSGLNYTLKSAMKALFCFTQGFLGYFRPCLLKRTLEGFNWHMRKSTGICLQKGPNTKVHQVKIWWWGWPNLLALKSWKMVLAPLLCLLGCVWWCTILLEADSLSLKCFLAAWSAGVKIVSMYEHLYSFLLLVEQKWWGTSMFLKWRPTPWQKKVSVTWKRFSWSQECLQRTLLGLCHFVGCRLPQQWTIFCQRKWSVSNFSWSK